MEGESRETAVIESPAGLRLEVLDLGATIRSLEIPVNGVPRGVVLAYPDVASYQTDKFYIGSTVGPFANRIGGASFELDGCRYDLDANEMPAGNTLHGGRDGLHIQCFTLTQDDSNSRVSCSAFLPDGLGGFPGNREVKVTYQLLGDLAIAIDFDVSTDKDTVVSLANHAYFNLGGDIADHEICIQADAYTLVDDARITTGEIAAVAGTDFDLRTLARVGSRVFDHNFALAPQGDEPQAAATLRSKSGGLELTMLTTQPGLQLYTGDFLSAPFVPRQGICLEAQGYPDAPNKPSFPSARLAAGSSYRQRSIFAFSEISD